MFYIVKGKLTIQDREENINLSEGEFFIVPKGVEHRPVTEDEVHIMLIEPRSTVNTGNIINEVTANDEWI